MFNWLTRKSTTETILVVHIDSGHVAAGLVRMTDHERPQIVRSYQSVYTTHATKEYERIFDHTKRALRTCLEKLLHGGSDAPVRIITSLGAPWTASQTRTLEITNPKDGVFTEREANQRIQEEIDAFHEARISSFAKYAHDHQLLEHKTMGVRLNGYHTDNPLSKKASHIAMDSFMSVIPRQVYQKFTQIIEKTFHTEHEHHSAMFVSYAVIQGILGHRSEALIIDIGAEITEVGIIHNNILLQSISFPFGYHDIERGLAKEHNFTHQEAVSMIHMYEHNLLSRTRHHEIERSLYTLYGVWIKRFHTLIKEAVTLEVLPHAIFLYAPDDIAALFTHCLEDDTLTHYTRNQQAYVVTPMNISTFKGHAIDTQQNYYPHVLQMALFAQTAHRRPRPPKKYYW